MIDILNKASSQFKQNLPFVIYKKPDSSFVIGIFQQNDNLFFIENYNEIGFVFAPFDGSDIVLIPENQSEIFVADFIKSNIKDKSDSKSEDLSINDKYNFETLVQKGIFAIEEGLFDKVVLSRKELTDLYDFDLEVLFQKLLNEYPLAYVYCFFHPKIGLWFGAFAEQLVKIQGNVFHTMAVAGTQKNQDDIKIVWGEKEKQEQQFVTDFIVENLKNRTSEISVSDPYNMIAGNIVHIKTDIKGILKKDTGLVTLLEILHPTPAVCGLPKVNAKDFILKNEGYNREYYSGYFGEINKNFSSGECSTDLYVNLRCMQIKMDDAKIISKAHLYMGCGVTKASIPEKEWEETVNKSITIKKILN
jgi:isochorismate synthase